MGRDSPVEVENLSFQLQKVFMGSVRVGEKFWLCDLFLFKTNNAFTAVKRVE